MSNEANSPSRIPRRRLSAQSAAFREFYVTYYPFVKQTAIYSCSSLDEAEHVAQETMVKAWRAFERFDHQYPKAWLRRILGRVVIDRYHKFKRQRDVFLDKDFDDVERTSEGMLCDINIEEDFELLERYLTNESGDDLEAWSQRHLSAELKVALENISPHHRVVIIARELLELSYQEIHMMLDIPQGTVMSRLHRARHALQSELLTARDAD